MVTEAVESLAERIAKTPADQFARSTAARLRQGLDPDLLLAGACLAAARGTELPFSHHGGPLHPIAAVPMAAVIAASLPAELRWLPALQVAALAAKHLHDPSMGPSVQPEMEPLQEATPEKTAQALRQAVRRRQPVLAEHLMLGLLAYEDATLTRETTIRLALSNYATDEHKLIFAVNALRAVERLGAGLAPPLLRLVARYNALPDWFDRPDGVDKQIHSAMSAAGLAERPPIRDATADESAGITALRRELRAGLLAQAPNAIAEALSEGLSIESAGEAITLAACDLFLQWDTQNPMGIHFMTGAHALRQVARSLQDPLLAAEALLHWSFGPETRAVKAHGGEDWLPDNAIPGDDPLPALQAAIEAEDLEGAPTAVLFYGGEGADAAPVQRLLAQAAAADSATELHGMKHIGAMLEEFERAKDGGRWIMLAAAAKQAALIHGRDTSVLESAGAD